MRRAELIVAALLLAAGASGAAFTVVYAGNADTQLLGLSVGVGLLLLAAALIAASRLLVPQERRSEERARFAQPGEANPEEAEDAAARIAAGGERITRRRLLVASGGAAVAGLGAAAVSPLASLGPGVGDTLRKSPWRSGVALLDENDMPVRADSIDVGSFLTAFPAGADKKGSASPVIVVRVQPEELRLPPDRADWAPKGLLAFSKICTHAGCAVSLFRYPLYPARSPGPALVCPCHYSTFDVLRGGPRTFGPASRGLPQLPLQIGANGELIAAGGLSGNVGPSWWGVRRT